MADKAEGKTRKKPVRRTDEERKAYYLAQAAKIENKDAERKAKRVKVLVAEIAILDQRIAKLEATRADKDAELADLAVETAEGTQLTFSEAKAEEV
jgi:hypothetical protein